MAKPASCRERGRPASEETVEEEASDGDDDQEELEEEIAAAEEVILRGNSSSSSSGGMIADYFYAVDDAMLRLEEEARSLLSSSSPSLRRLSLSSDDLGDATPDASPRHGTLSPTALASMGAVAARMLRAGYGPELAQVSVALLGVEAIAIEEVLWMEWSALDQRMRRWSHAVRAVVRTFLADELLTLLLHNIDDKSRLYDNAGLQNIFLMNNLYYVVQKMRESPPLRELVGDDWLRRHRGQIRQYETGYLRASWTAVLSQLRRDDGASARPPAGHRAPSGPSAKSFNAAFQELYRTQTAWKVADAQLREELRIAVSERLIPAYRAFLGQGSRHPARHVKCSLEDLEDYMLDFFEGAQKFVRW